MNIYQELRDEMTAFDEYLAYMFEQKQSPTLDKADKEIPLDILVAELFFPKKEENKETEALVKEMGQQAAKCWMKEFRDKKKATSDNFDGDRSWANTSEEDHHNLLGTMATNDLSEQPFGMLTYQVDRFNRVLFGNAAATAQARMNGDFDRAELGEGHVDGAFHKLTDKLKHSLLITALKYARETTIKESDALKKQRNFKLKKMASLKAKKILKATDEYTKALIYIETYHSSACWKTEQRVRTEYNKLKSESAKKEAMKTQINIRTIGFGWTDMHHAWSKGGIVFTGDQLKEHFLNKILPYERNHSIPEVPNVNLPSRQETLSFKLGTPSHDVQKLNNKSKVMVEEFKKQAKEELKKQDFDGKFQTILPPKIDERFVG